MTRHSLAASGRDLIISLFPLPNLWQTFFLLCSFPFPSSFSVRVLPCLPCTNPSPRPFPFVPFVVHFPPPVFEAFNQPEGPPSLTLPALKNLSFPLPLCALRVLCGKTSPRFFLFFPSVFLHRFCVPLFFLCRLASLHLFFNTTLRSASRQPMFSNLLP